jgi:hypothetical protein
LTQQNASGIVKVAIICIILLGISTLSASILYQSSFFAIAGFSLLFWGIVLLYLIPTRNNLSQILSISAETASANIESILAEMNSEYHAVYLLKESKNTLAELNENHFVLPMVCLAKKQVKDAHLISSNEGVGITPPGYALFRSFEEQLGRSFSQITLKQFTNVLPKILIRRLKIAESMNVEVLNNSVNVEIMGSFVEQICREADKTPRTHKQVGCLFSSAIACALLKVTGQPITIKSETRDLHTKITRIQYTYGFGV